jgi:hypothetical protein
VAGTPIDRDIEGHGNVAFVVDGTTGFSGRVKRG